ncbi:hypothetical protein V8E51_003360 [Hyaloscypha variabilis]
MLTALRPLVERLVFALLWSRGAPNVPTPPGQCDCCHSKCSIDKSVDIAYSNSASSGCLGLFENEHRGPNPFKLGRMCNFIQKPYRVKSRFGGLGRTRETHPRFHKFLPAPALDW